MDITSLTSFLLSSKRNVDYALNKTSGDIHAVLGNEAVDLDSAVSSVVTAYYIAHSTYKEEKENKSEEKQSFVISVINCTRQDLPLRTEVVFFLKDNGIRVEDLICRDEIDLNRIHVSGRLRLTLVDHNVLAPVDLYLTPSICRVIDHHKREKSVDRRDTIELVGSCCTLVAQIVLNLIQNDHVVTRLLYGTIILDTYNFSDAAQRTTAKDLAIAEKLEEILYGIPGAGNRDKLFNALIHARADVSSLTPPDLLRKDAKVLRTPDISIVLPAVPLLVEEFLKLPKVLEALKSCLRTTFSNVIVVICFSVNETSGELTKGIIVFSDSIRIAKQISNPLEKSELDLRLVRSSTDNQSVLFVYHQGNIGLSRKFILPFLATYFEGKANQMDPTSWTGDSSPVTAFPSISYTSVHHLGVGDPVSECGSTTNSAYNSCPYTPQNSSIEPPDGPSIHTHFLPSFNSREMLERIELKRGKLRGYDRTDDELRPSYPFTPKNSYVESSFEALYQANQIDRVQSGRIIDSDLVVRKLLQNPRNDSPISSSNSSKSQSVIKLNPEDSLTPNCPEVCGHTFNLLRPAKD